MAWFNSTTFDMETSSEVIVFDTIINNQNTLATRPTVSAGAYDGDVQGNPIGELQEYTQKNLLRPPVYEFIGEQGPPHAREFVCTVKLAKLQETGSEYSHINMIFSTLAKIYSSQRYPNRNIVTSFTVFSFFCSRW